MKRPGTHNCASFFSANQGLLDAHRQFLRRGLCYGSLCCSFHIYGHVPCFLVIPRRYYLFQTPLVLLKGRNPKVTAAMMSATTVVPSNFVPSVPSVTPFHSPSKKSLAEASQNEASLKRTNSNIESKTKNQTRRKPPQRKKRETAPTVASSAIAIEVDVSATIREWQLLMRTNTSFYTMHPLFSNGTVCAAALARNSNHHTDTYAKTPAKTASKTSLEGPTSFLSEILKTPQEYPQMHALFYKPHLQDSSPSCRGRMSVLPAVDLKLTNLSNILCGDDSEFILSVLLSFLRMYRRLSSQSTWMTAVYRRFLEVFLSESSRVWSRILVSELQIQGWHHVVRQCAWVLLELYCIQLDHKKGSQVKKKVGKNNFNPAVAMEKAIVQVPLSRRAPQKAKALVKTVPGGEMQTVESDWRESIIKHFLESVVQLILHKLAGVSIDIDPIFACRTISDLSFEYSFVLLAIELIKGDFCENRAEITQNTMRHEVNGDKDYAFALDKCSKIAEERRNEIKKNFSDYIRFDPADTGSVSIEACNFRLEDALLALHVTQAFALIVPHDFKQYVQVQATHVLHLSCRAVRSRPDIFPLLCSETLAYQLEQLKEWPGSPYGQMCTDIFAAAAVFLELRETSLPALLDEKERTRQAALRASNLGLVEDQLPPRPLLHGSAAQLFYTMLCVGYAPEVVLQNAVHLSLDALAFVSITAATALFSESFATNSLPVRVKTTLMDAALAYIGICVKSARRLAVSHAESLMQIEKGKISLSSRLEHLDMQVFGTKPTCFPINASKLGNIRSGKINSVQQNSNTEIAIIAKESQLQATEVVTLDEMNQLVDQTLYMVLSVAVEFLTRGDEATSRNLILNLFPILEREGSTVYLIEALEVLTVKITKRLAYVGAMEIRTDCSMAEDTCIHRNSRDCVTTLSMEQGFSEMVALFQQRVSATIFHRFTGNLTKKGSFSSHSLSADSTASQPFSLFSDALPGVEKKGNSDDGTVTTTAAGAIAIPVLSLSPILELIFRFTACALICGMDMNTVKQLTSVHMMLLKAKDTAGGFNTSSGKKAPTVTNIAADPFLQQGQSSDDVISTASQVVEQLDQLMTCVTEKRFPIIRHPQSAHMRTTNVALNHIVGVNLKSIPVLGARVYIPRDTPNQSIASLSKRQRRFALSIIHLLFRLSTNHPIEAEPTALRVFRTDLLDPVVAQVLRESASDPPDEHNHTSDLSLTILSEIAVVICVPHTIHLVSRDLYTGLSDMVVQIMKCSRRNDARSSTTGAIIQRLLCASSTICLRGDAQLTSFFIRVLQATESYLTLRQTVHVLDEMLACQVPIDAVPVSRMLQRLVQALSEMHPKTGRPILSLPDCIATLRTLARYDGIIIANTEDAAPLSSRDRKCSNNSNTFYNKNSSLKLMVPYGSTLARLCRPENIQRQRITLSEYGELVHIAAVLSRRTEASEACDPAEKALILKLPRMLSVPVLQSPQAGMEHDTPAVIRGYAEVTNDEAVRAQVLRGFISRTIRACPTLSPEEVVQCVEGYCAAGIYHEYLFSVLLGRVADITQRFSLNLSLRLLRCGIHSGHPLVKTACVTAAKPVFVAHVRHILQSDPSFITSVGLTSTSILRCLRDCFPQEPISAAVLENIAVHKQGMRGAVVIKAALELIAVRGSHDYNTLRTLADYTTSELICTSGPRDLADLLYLLVVCGVRSGALLMNAAARFSEVRREADGYTLARIMEALQRSCVDAGNTLFSQLVDRIVELVDVFLNSTEDLISKKKDAVRRVITHGGDIEAPFTVSQVSVILNELYTGGKHNLAIVMPAVDALLKYLSRLWNGTRVSVTDRDYSASGLVAREVEIILRSCVEQASHPKEHRDVLRACADQLNFLLDDSQRPRPLPDSGIQDSNDINNEAQRETDTSVGDIPFNNYANTVHCLEDCKPQTNAAGALWRGDLLMLVNLASFLTRGGEVAHPVLCRIFTLVFEKRVTLLKRHLLFETVKQTMEAAGEGIHPELHSFVVKGKLLS